MRDASHFEGPVDLDAFPFNRNLDGPCVQQICIHCTEKYEEHGFKTGGWCLICVASPWRNQTVAYRLVRKAIKDGRLKKPDSLQCTDCGKPAFCFDHRSYRRPLDVVPVCRSCNIKRGSADGGRANKATEGAK